MAEKILIVDDDIDSLKLIGLMLQRHSYEVVAANTGSQGLAKANAEHPDLIILDVMMPDMNGYEVCRKLRENPDTQAIPIIMFTAKTLIDDKVAGFEAGADDYLTKPTHPAELASRVKTILERSADRRQQNNVSGTTIGVIGTKGGVGTTTVALNIAAAFQLKGESPIVADFCLGKGTMGYFLGSDTPTGMASVISKPKDDITPSFVNDEIVTHTTGLRALLSSTRPRETHLNFTADSALSVVKALKTLTQLLVLDLGNGYSPLFNRLKNELSLLLMVVEPTSISMKTAQQILAELGDKAVEIVVVNRDKSDESQTPWQDIEIALGREIRAIITASPDIAFDATENGMPIVNFSPNSVISGQLTKLAEKIQQKN
ncbi:MAG: response regulator [Aggregatilineales bacterium]